MCGESGRVECVSRDSSLNHTLTRDTAHWRTPHRTAIPNPHTHFPFSLIRTVFMMSMRSTRSAAVTALITMLFTRSYHR